MADIPTPPSTTGSSPGRIEARPTILDAALKGLCPRCGQRTLFDGWIHFAPTCRACGLDHSCFNVGDGPAAFLTLILGALVTGLAVWLQVAVSPPWWVHLILRLPLTFAGGIASLRLAKGALIAAEYRNAAREGRIQ